MSKILNLIHFPPTDLLTSPRNPTLNEHLPPGLQATLFHMDENQCPSNNCLSKLALTVTANFGLALSTRRNFVPAEARICQMA